MSETSKAKSNNESSNNNTITNTTTDPVEDIENNDIHNIKSVFGGLVTKVEKRIKLLEAKEQHWAALEKLMQEHAAAATNKIVLDIGGQRFATSKTTLLAFRGSFFDAMLSSGKWQPDADGTYFIDRNPELFPIILDFLRMGKVNLKKYVMEDLEAELDFYQIVIPSSALPTMPFKESKLLNTQQKQQVTDWLGCKTASLLYSAARDGSAAFHDKCDNKGPTVVVAKSTGGYLFGGYTSQKWDSTGTYKNDANAFLYTLTNPYYTPRKFAVTQPQNAIYCHAAYGPTFGAGHDLHINAGSSSSGFPRSYNDTIGNGNNTFTGCQSFQTSDVEIYLVS